MLASVQLAATEVQGPADPQLTFFGQDPWWLVLIKIVLAFVLLLLLTLFNIWLERRVVARMQHRIGPNMNGPFGLLQSLADGVKLIVKEDLIPKAVDKVVYMVAPLIAIITCFLSIAVMPLGPVVDVPFSDIQTPLQLTDLPVAVLFVLAIASIEIYGIVLAGWSSGSTYPLLGAVRSSAQMVSYEVAMGLSLVAVFLYSGTMSTSGIVAAQQDLWFGITLLPSFIIYVIAMTGETNRAPFDLPEGEGEIVGGFHTEYSSFKFAAFFLAEYINMVTVAMLATTMFLGGWRAPFPLSLWDGANQGYLPIVWFLGKVLFFMFIFIWLRGTLPRFRYDQFMKLGWKVLIPASMVWIVAVGTMKAFEDDIADIPRMWLLIGGAVFVVIFLALGLIGGDDDSESEPAVARQGHIKDDGSFDALAGGFPVPPMPSKEKSAHG